MSQIANHQGGFERWVIEDTAEGYLGKDALEKPLEIGVAEFEKRLIGFKHLISEQMDLDWKRLEVKLF